MNSPRKAIMIAVVIIATGFLAFISFNRTSQNGFTPISQAISKIPVNINGIEIEAEVASTDAERATGLMNREFLPRYSGMLFVYGSEAQRTFWMKNTLIPLDIIFLNSNKEVVSISSNTVPNQTDKLYYSKFPAQFILELNAGMAEELEINTGNVLEFANTF